jgi:O-antigen/teichoic acid export membrane protein
MWALVARVLAGLAGFGANALIARLLSPADVGVYFLLITIVTFTAGISQGGLQIGVVRLGAEALGRGLPGRARGAIAKTIWLTAASGAVFGVATTLAGPAASAWLGGIALPLATIVLVGLWIPGLSLVNLVAECFRGLHEYRLASLLNTAVPNLLTLAGVGVLIGAGLTGQLSLVIGVVVGVLAGVIVLALILLGQRLSALGPATAVGAGELLATGLPLMVTSLAIYAMTQMDVWIVGALCGKQDVALYGSAARLVLLVMMPMLIGNVVLPPLVAELHGRAEPQRLERLVRTTATLSGLIAVPVLLVLLVAAGPILALAYGEYYRAGGAVLILLCAGQTINVLAGPGSTVLMMTGGGREVMAISIFSGLLLAGTAWLAAGQFGMVGVAAAAGGSSATHGLLCMAVVRYRNGIWTGFGFTQLRGSVAEIRLRLGARD